MTAKPTPAPGQQIMDAVLFHPETSLRRALILALGTYGTEGLSPSEREPLIGKLLELYRNDPDAGIHGAAEWTLRQWKNEEKLKGIDAELSKLKDWGERRWFVNSLGQTFAVIEGPVEFVHGLAPDRSGSFGRRNTTPCGHSPSVCHRHQRGLQGTVAGIREAESRGRSADVNRFSPDPDGPMIGVNWFLAAAFCNWLSGQDGLPKDQWCYLPAEKRGIHDGDDDPRRCSPAQGLSPADRGGVGIRLPVRYDDLSLLWFLPRSARRVCSVPDKEQGPRMGVRESPTE